MAKLPSLVNAFKAWDGRSPVTIDHWARTIRKAGLITPTKRGVGAAQVTFSDAANLLMGLNGATGAPEAPASIEALSRLTPRLRADFRGLRDAYSPDPDLAFLAEPDTFGEVLTLVLARAPDIASWVARRYDLEKRQWQLDHFAKFYMDNSAVFSPEKQAFPDLPFVPGPFRLEIATQPFEARLFIGELVTWGDLGRGFHEFYAERNALRSESAPPTALGMSRRPVSFIGLEHIILIHRAVAEPGEGAAATGLQEPGAESYGMVRAETDSLQPG